MEMYLLLFALSVTEAVETLALVTFNMCSHQTTKNVVCLKVKKHLDGGWTKKLVLLQNCSFINIIIMLFLFHLINDQCLKSNYLLTKVKCYFILKNVMFLSITLVKKILSYLIFFTFAWVKKANCSSILSQYFAPVWAGMWQII